MPPSFAHRQLNIDRHAERPDAGPVALIFKDAGTGCTICVVAHFSPAPSSVTTDAQFVTVPMRLADEDGFNGLALACGDPAQRETSLPLSLTAGGFERTNFNPSGIGLVTVAERNSDLPSFTSVDGERHFLTQIGGRRRDVGHGHGGGQPFDRRLPLGDDDADPAGRGRVGRDG